MRILIVVDDFLIGESLRQIVQKHGAIECKIIDSKSFVLESINSFLPSLVFIHILKEKPLIGIEIGQFLSEETSVLFAYISAQSDLKIMDLAIQTNPIVYILKPFREEEIYAIMQIARQKKKMEYLHLKDNYEILQIPILDIIYIKSENNYIEIIGKSKKWVVRNTLQNIINLLPKSDFLQIHRSYVVNRKYIDKVSNKELFVEGMNIPISKSHVEKLKEIMVF
jgi:two-component system, LytTR family, response regulator LytT